MDFSLIIEIESGHVRGSLVKLGSVNQTDSQTRHIFYTVSETILRTPHTLNDRLISEMAHAVSRVVHEIVHKGVSTYPKGRITSIHYVLSSPWIVTKTKTVRISYQKLVAITKKSIEKIIETEHDALRNSVEFDFNTSFVEQKIFEIKLDGYPVLHLDQRSTLEKKHSKKVPKKAKEIEVSFAMTLSSESVTSKIHDAVERVVRVKDESYHSALLLLYAAVRNVFNEAKDYMVAHVHGEVSDIVLIKDDVFSVIASFPFGTSTFVRKSSRAFDESEHLMRSMLALHSKKALHGEYHAKVGSHVLPIVRSWSTDLISTVSKAQGVTGTFPKTVFLFARDHHSHFEEALRTDVDTMKIDIIPMKHDTLLDMYTLALNTIQSYE